MTQPPAVICDTTLTLTALTALPEIAPGADLAALLVAALQRQSLAMIDSDVLVVSSKVVAKAEDRYVDLSRIEPSPSARELAARSGKDPRLCEVVLWDSQGVSRARAGALIVRHGGGHVSANAGVDLSNTRAGGTWALRLPLDPDASARRLRDRLATAFEARVAVVISDSFGRPFRLGTVGVAVGAAGLPPLYDQRGRVDMHGRRLEATFSAPADQLAGACDLLLGQADERRAAALVRGLRFTHSDAPATSLCRPPEEDLYL